MQTTAVAIAFIAPIAAPVSTGAQGQSAPGAEALAGADQESDAATETDAAREPDFAQILAGLLPAIPSAQSRGAETDAAGAPVTTAQTPAPQSLFSPIAPEAPLAPAPLGAEPGSDAQGVSTDSEAALAEGDGLAPRLSASTQSAGGPRDPTFTSPATPAQDSAAAQAQASPAQTQTAQTQPTQAQTAQAQTAQAQNAQAQTIQASAAQSAPLQVVSSQTGVAQTSSPQGVRSAETSAKGAKGSAEAKPGVEGPASAQTNGRAAVADSLTQPVSNALAANDAEAQQGSDAVPSAAAQPDIGPSEPATLKAEAAQIGEARPTAAAREAAPAAAPVRAGSETVAHLAAQIAQTSGGRATRFDIQLQPHGLGTVDVRVEIGARGELTAALTFDTPQTASDLRSRSGELQRALEQAGFDLSRGGLSFNSGGEGQGQAQQFADQQPGGGAWRGRAFSASVQAAADLDAALTPTPSLSRDGGVDVRI